MAKIIIQGKGEFHQLYTSNNRNVARIEKIGGVWGPIALKIKMAVKFLLWRLLHKNPFSELKSK